MADELSAIPLRPEAARYAARLIFLGGLWTGPTAWAGFAGYLAHRGWEGAVIDTRATRGGFAARAERVAGYLSLQASPAILVAHDVGCVTALLVAAKMRVAAVAMLAPLVPGHRALRGAVPAGALLWAILSGRAVPAPRDDRAIPGLHELPAALRRRIAAEARPEDVWAVRDAVRGAWPPVTPPAPVPMLVVSGGADTVVRSTAVAALAHTLGAAYRDVAGAGHWLPCGPEWEAGADVVHRWAVQRLGAAGLDFYREAMAERGDSEDDR